MSKGMETPVGTVRPGARVGLHPRLDVWMMGDRYATVQTVGRKWLHVRGDSGRTWKIHPADIVGIYGDGR